MPNTRTTTTTAAVPFCNYTNNAYHVHLIILQQKIRNVKFIFGRLDQIVKYPAMKTNAFHSNISIKRFKLTMFEKKLVINAVVKSFTKTALGFKILSAN